MATKLELNPNTEVEVVMIKKMSFGEYNRVRENAMKKGWDIKAYEIGYYGKKK